jgi:hypothetical protein
MKTKWRRDEDFQLDDIHISLIWSEDGAGVGKEIFTITSGPTETWTGYLQNTSLKFYPFTTLLSTEPVAQCYTTELSQ